MKAVSFSNPTAAPSNPEDPTSTTVPRDSLPVPQTHASAVVRHAETTAVTSASMSVPVKIETKEEEEHNVYNQTYISQEGPSQTNTVSKKLMKGIFFGPSGRIRRFIASKHISHMNRRRLHSILRKLTRAHRWKEASGVLSILLRGTPSGVTFEGDEKNFQVAMEIYKRFWRETNYQMRIKQVYEVLMSKFTWTKKLSLTKHVIQLELALFYLTQGNVQEAYTMTKFLVQDRDTASDPKVNLIHGLILYELWYSGLPGEMQIKVSDLYTPFEMQEAAFNDGCQESETVESSNDHYAVHIEDNKFASHIASETSVGNDKKVFTGCGTDVPRKQSHDVRAHKFYMSQSADTNERTTAAPDHDNSLMYNSIFFAQGLGTSLLPIRLIHSDGDPEQSICSHRKLVNEHYTSAVKHLQLALYSTPPLLAALQPLIQLLLLGDRVEDALKELEKFCHKLDLALPFRLRARLLECFCSNHATVISNCYENVLKRDPTCNHSLDRLIKMNRTGHYDPMQLLEMIALHLDATSGKSSTWGEFASCFIRLLNTMQSDCEDRISINERRSVTGILSRHRIPKDLTEGYLRDSWRLRCRWWMRHHFSKSSYLSDIQTGDWRLPASKAAVASHLYGARFGYVIGVLRSLRNEGKKELISFLGSHMEQSMKLYENLDMTY